MPQHTTAHTIGTLVGMLILLGATWLAVLLVTWGTVALWHHL